MIGEVTYYLVAHTLVIEFKNNLAEHVNHQVGVVIRGKCEILVHAIQTMLNLHPYWAMHVDVYNAFNFMSRSTIF
jgi:hypothetical protein